MEQERIWTNCSEYMPSHYGLDWVLVYFMESQTGFAGLPYIAEYNEENNWWHTQLDDKWLDGYLNDMCTAVCWAPIPKFPLTIE